ncbi:MAG: acyltransferase [Chitinophagaceae bacterium]|nr:MAG: acyltransferase [Chitinophagaceae bacterium]
MNLSAACSRIFKATGWTVDTNLPPEIKKCIIIAAPHTSNWDFWYTMAAFAIYRLKIRFTVKKEWMKFPFSLLMKPLGGIAIDRTPRTAGADRKSFVEAMIDLFRQNEELIILITPEGTRSFRDKWKTGFYHVAQGAGVPICLGYVDYAKKKAGIGKVIYPGDYAADMQVIMAFYGQVTAKFPENFAVDKDFAP